MQEFSGLGGERNELTSCSHDRAVDASLLTLIRDDQRPDHICPDRLELVVFAPVDIGAASFASAVDDVRWPDLIENFLDLYLVLHTDASSVDIFALGEKELLEVSAYPAGSTAPDEKASSWMCYSVAHDEFVLFAITENRQSVGWFLSH